MTLSQPMRRALWQLLTLGRTGYHRQTIAALRRRGLVSAEVFGLGRYGLTYHGVREAWRVECELRESGRLVA